MELRDIRPLLATIERKRKGMTIDTWDYDGPVDPWSAHSYEYTFKDFLPQKTSFEKLIAERPKGKRNVLDLFGSGYFIQDLGSFDHLVGARQTNVDDIWIRGLQKRNHPSDAKDILYLQRARGMKNRTIIPGNLYTQAPWRRIRNLMHKQHIPSFDLITCRPEGAFDQHHIGSSAHFESKAFGQIFLPMFLRAYDLLSPSGGMLFTQIPEIPDAENIMNRFISHAQNISGIEVKFADRDTFHMPHVLYLKKNTPSSIRQYFMK